jgi:V-type H+-transporting ATPase subunit a
MKFAVIIGVLQMTLGILLKGLNSIYFSSALDFIFEFIPQFVFLLAMFGYMDLLIILKWLTNYSRHESLAPSIIS